MASANYEVDIPDIRSLLPNTNKTRGSALDYILDRTLMRPRDAIAYFNTVLEGVNGRPRMTWDLIHSAETSYSKGRLLALRDEWKPTYPGIERVFSKFQNCSAVLTTRELESVLDEVALLLATPEMGSSTWLTEYCAGLWEPQDLPWVERYGALTRLLYDIGFLGVIRGRRRNTLYSYGDGDALTVDSVFDDISGYAIHPAFQQALDVGHSVREEASIQKGLFP